MNRIYRIIDVNINRICEGLRVIEDNARFNIENKIITEKIKLIRHKIRKYFKNIDNNLLNSRDSINDFGKDILNEKEIDNKKNLVQIVISNFKRIEEGLRVLEENLKIIGNYDKSKYIENIRFEIYSLEKEYLGLIKFTFPVGIYAITAEKFSNGKDNITVVKELIKGGAKIIQYREKDKSMKEKYRECKIIRDITKDNGILFIVNDDIDLAIVTEADGVHLGQDDMPLEEARRLIGNKIIGLSTHSPEQAQEAVKLGVDYIGVGPIFKTYTKENVCAPVGLEYLEYVEKNINLPYTAIGGIKEHNIKQILERGAKTISLVTELVGADDIALKTKKINEIINNYLNNLK